MKKKTNLLVITSYPLKGQTHGVGTVGVASYAKNILTNILKVKSQNSKVTNITVLAERFDDQSQEYVEKGITVKRVWQRNNLFSLWQLFKTAAKEKEKNVLVSYEKNMVGGTIANVFFLILLFFLKLYRKRIFIVLHQVVGDFGEIGERKIKASYLNFLKDILYRVISVLADKIIVFEDQFVKSLPDSSKVVIIPHAVEKYKPVFKNKARRILKLKKEDFHVLYFGFLSPYKGIENLILNFNPSTSLRTRLIIAGGGNPNYAKDKNYCKYVNTIKIMARKNNATLTGFVEEKDIPYYFSACDVVVLPYKSFFSSSGPLSLAFSFKKPVLLSRPLEAYFESKDFNTAALKTGLKKEDFLFDFDSHDFSAKLVLVRKKKQKFINFAKEMEKKREWKFIAKEYMELLEMK